MATSKPRNRWLHSVAIETYRTSQWQPAAVPFAERDHDQFRDRRGRATLSVTASRSPEGTS